MICNDIKTKFTGIWIREEELENGKIEYWLVCDRGGETEYPNFPTETEIDEYREWCIDEYL